MVKGRVNYMYIKGTHMAHWQVKKNKLIVKLSLQNINI
jgi:hypothetical protein